MSLSKYYPKSDAFQPEKIVRNIQDGTFVKVPPPKSARDHFVSEDKPAIQPRHDPPAGKAEDTPPSPLSSPPKKVPVEKLAPEPPSAAVIARVKAEAYQQGSAEAMAKAEEDFGTASRALLSCCEQLDSIRGTIITNSSGELRDFALAIAERILRISLQEQDQTIIATIEEALQRAVKSDAFTVYLHPDDYRIVTEKSAELIAGLSGLNGLVIKKDITIDRGGAKIESDNCTIDATVATQFAAIRDEVMKIR
jgi:flagellar assembly protein FliH